MGLARPENVRMCFSFIFLLSFPCLLLLCLILIWGAREGERGSLSMTAGNHESSRDCRTDGKRGKSHVDTITVASVAVGLLSWPFEPHVAG